MHRRRMSADYDAQRVELGAQAELRKVLASLRKEDQLEQRKRADPGTTGGQQLACKAGQAAYGGAAPLREPALPEPQHLQPHQAAAQRLRAGVAKTHVPASLRQRDVQPCEGGQRAEGGGPAVADVRLPAERQRPQAGAQPAALRETQLVFPVVWSDCYNFTCRFCIFLSYLLGYPKY